MDDLNRRITFDSSGNVVRTAPRRPNRRGRAIGIAVCGLLLAFFAGSRTARAAWQEFTHFLSLQGGPERASANVLSEHEIEVLDGMTPQQQAGLLLERSINHYRGANEQIAARVGRWRGGITLDDRLTNLYSTALNSGDLRVRAAAIEVDIVARGLEKSVSTIDRLEPDARSGAQGPRANALWDIGLLGSRGIEPARAAQILLSSVQDDNVNIRYWAVEGLSYLGTDEVIAPLLDVLRNDTSPMIRERAACGLAQSGMLSERQRRTAVPRLLDFADDGSLDAETRKWVFQALRDITGQTLPHDADAWRNWYTSGGADWRPVTRDGIYTGSEVLARPRKWPYKRSCSRATPLYRSVPRRSRSPRASPSHCTRQGARERLAVAACALASGVAMWTLNPRDFHDVPELRLI